MRRGALFSGLLFGDDATLALATDGARHATQRLAAPSSGPRTTLQSGGTTTIPLKKELGTVRVYLELEAVRFEERLRYAIDVDDALLARAVPFLLAQTLVESAIRRMKSEMRSESFHRIPPRVIMAYGPPTKRRTHLSNGTSVTGQVFVLYFCAAADCAQATC